MASTGKDCQNLENHQNTEEETAAPLTTEAPDTPPPLLSDTSSEETLVERRSRRNLRAAALSTWKAAVRATVAVKRSQQKHQREGAQRWGQMLLARSTGTFHG